MLPKRRGRPQIYVLASVIRFEFYLFTKCDLFHKSESQSKLICCGINAFTRIMQMFCEKRLNCKFDILKI